MEIYINRKEILAIKKSIKILKNHESEQETVKRLESILKKLHEDSF